MSKTTTTIRKIIDILENIDSYQNNKKIKYIDFELKYNHGMLNIQFTPQKNEEYIKSILDCEKLDFIFDEKNGILNM